MSHKSKTPGQVAYEAFCEGQPTLVRWEDLWSGTQKQWERVAMRMMSWGRLEE